MNGEIEILQPDEIEKRSFEIIESELPHPLDPELAPVIKRVIHATADFDYADNLYFSPEAVPTAISAIKKGAHIITDTNMAKAGINKKALARTGSSADCFMADEDIKKTAGEKKTTRAAASMDKAFQLGEPLIFAIGNAPTALLRLNELIREEGFRPILVIGVPVGFVNVLPAKERIMEAGIPCIVARGRKGGSTVAAAIVNALLYQAGGRG